MLNKPEDIYKIKIQNIENFQDILKNKTLNDLEHLPDKPIDLPLQNANSNNKIKESKDNSAKNSIKKTDEKANMHKANNNLKEKNSLVFDINKKENFRFLNKLSDSNNFDLLKFRQHNLDNDSKDNNNNNNYTTTSTPNAIEEDFLLNKNNNNKCKNKNITTVNLNEKSELQHALENKIKYYYSHNKNYLEKQNKNLTTLDKKFLGSKESIAADEINKSSLLANNQQSEGNKISVSSEADKNEKMLTTFIQNINANINSDLKEIANKFLNKKPKMQIDLKGN